MIILNDSLLSAAKEVLKPSWNYIQAYAEISGRGFCQMLKRNQVDGVHADGLSGSKSMKLTFA